MMYKQLINSMTGQLSNMVLRTADGLYIPFDPANSDYQEFLRWCEEGNQPIPAEGAE